jgi:hypothetical protein
MPLLRISLSGLCTFAFDQPLKGSGPPPTEAYVLLQRLTRARKLTSLPNAPEQILDQHFPLLDFDLADADPASTRLADVHCTSDANGQMTKGTCLLLGEDLTFILDGREMAPNALELSRAAPADPAAPNLSPTALESLWWMATLEDAFPGKSEIKPEILDTPPGSNQPILSRLHLTQGRLRTTELTDAPCTIVPPVPGGFNQRVATAFEFTVQFGSTVQIHMVARRNGKRTESDLILRPAGNGDVQISVMNIEINRLVGLDPANGPLPEADFAVYSDLLKTPPDPGKMIPFLRQSTPGDPAGAGMSTCVPTGG